MKQRRLKIIAASTILLVAMVFLVLAMTTKTSVLHFTPAELVANAEVNDQQNLQVDGVIAEGSSTWDAANFKLTFAVQDRESNETVNVIYENRLKPDNFSDGGSVFVEGKYDATNNMIVATKLTTKCASKYEGAESTSSEKSSS
ncbi:cytochrome c maturation protein CcmE [Candidatus Poribacteria bacterium]|nr:cytochrome c maturation protein CcmE [Candidatus Poribacteria bacterium]